MKKCKIQLCLLGYQRFQDEIDKLSHYPSKLFEVSNCIIIKQLPDSDLCWGYSDLAITNLLKEKKVNNDKYDLCICFIDAPIENNYFSRDLSKFDNKTILCSFYQVHSIFKENNIDVFNYVHGTVLNRVVQIETLGEINENYYVHKDTRKCLYDMCGLKSDIALKYSEPKLCADCISKISSSAVDKDFISALEKEFNTFKKPLFDRIVEFVKKNPQLSIIITIVSTIIINILSSVIFEAIKWIISNI